MKIFGIGLSRTGTKSLTLALNNIGMHVIHFPKDETTLNEIKSGNYNLSILKECDGITDITVASFYPQLDRLFPQSKFILTIRDKASWLTSIQKYWSARPALEAETGNELKMQRRRFFRSVVYGTYTYNEERMSYVYDRHYQNVIEYFKARPESLLTLDICAGEGWEKLCPFLNQPLRNEPFPAVKR